MKKIHLSMSRPWVYLFELPLAGLFVLCILFHNRVDSLLKLFPLEIAVAAVMIFLPLYFFRFLSFATDEVREIGLFSGKDRAVLNKGRTLILTLRKKGKIRAEVYGKNGEEPAFAWQKNDRDYRASDFCMLRAAAYGGRKSIASLLSFYGVPGDDLAAAMQGGFSRNYGDISLETVAREDGETELRLHFHVTIL